LLPICTRIIKRIAGISGNGGEFYLLGDNSAVSIDSRTFGYIEKEALNGKVLFAIHL